MRQPGTIARAAGARLFAGTHLFAGVLALLFATAALLFLAGCAGLPAPDTRPQVLLVVPQTEIADVEYTLPRQALEAAGAHVTVASLDTGMATGKELRVQPDLAIDAARAGDYDAIAVIGGWGTMKQLWDHPGLHALLQEADREDRIVAAICAGPVVLARAGLLAGREATSSPDVKKGDHLMRDELSRHGAHYRDDSLVIVDGHFITGNGPKSSQDFGAALVKALQDKRD